MEVIKGLNDFATEQLKHPQEIFTCVGLQEAEEPFH